MVANTKQPLTSLRWNIDSIEDSDTNRSCFASSSLLCCLNNGEMSISSIAKGRGGARQFLDLSHNLYLKMRRKHQHDKSQVTIHDCQNQGHQFPVSPTGKTPRNARETPIAVPQAKQCSRGPISPPLNKYRGPKRGLPSRLEMTGQPQLPEITPTIRPILQSTQ